MLGLVVGVGLVAAVLFYWRYTARRAALRRFQAMMAVIAESRSAASRPDLNYAASAVVAIAAVRKLDPAADLATLAKANAWHHLKTGATEHQVISAHWGGVYAMADDLAGYQIGLAAFDAAVADQKARSEADAPRGREDAAARLYLEEVLDEHPQEFDRFVRSQDAKVWTG